MDFEAFATEASAWDSPPDARRSRVTRRGARLPATSANRGSRIGLTLFPFLYAPQTDDELAHSHKLQEEEREPTPGFKRFYADRSLGYFELDNPVRVFCMRVSEMPMFDNFILIAILANAIILCQMEPLKMEGRGCDGAPSDAGGNAVIEDTEILFTVVFTLECVVKVIAMGFLLDDSSYLKDGWNVMDFSVVVVSLLSNIPGLGSNVSALRVIRVLRPLRTLSIRVLLRCE